MNQSTSKLKRKRPRNSDGDRPLKQTKHTHSDKPLMHRSALALPLSSEHTQLLDSVEGHIGELTHIGDSPQESTEQPEEVLSKSAVRRLRKKNKANGHMDGGKSSTVAGKESALEYLRMWNEERQRWSFRKKTQFWLLQNMYTNSKVPKSHFKVLLCYLEGLKGHQRQLVVDRAQKILDDYSDGESSDTRREYKRAVAILRTLA